MPKPTEDATWATDGGTRVEPSAGEKADGFVPGARTPARKANWIVGVLSDFATWLDEIFDDDNEHIYDAGNNGPLRRTVIDPGNFDAWGHGSGDPEWATEFDVAGTGGKALKPRLAGARCSFCLEDYLPHGALVQSVAILVKPHQANAGADRMSLAWYEQEEVYTGTEGVVLTGPTDQTFDDTTANLQLISMAGVNIDIETQLFEPLGALASRRHFVVIFASGNTITDECLFSVIVVWDDAPGLRNY